MEQIDIERLTGRTVYSGGECYLYFGGTAYLGVPYHPIFKQALKKGMQIFGSNYSSSRKGNVAISVYKETECLLCDWLGLSGSTTFSSGYLASQAIMGWIEKSGYKSVRVNGDHPALWLGEKGDPNSSSPIIYKSGDEMLQNFNHFPEDKTAILATSVNPMTGEIYDFSWVEKIKQKTILVIDDSHGLGILGKNGRGILDAIPANSLVKIVIVSSMGKALGIPGGLIAADKTIIEEIKSQSMFMASSPISPAYLCAFLYSGSLYDQQRQRLFENLEDFNELSMDWRDCEGRHPVYPIPGKFQELPKDQFKNENKEEQSLYFHLANKKILVSSFRYPSIQSELTTRIVINATHQPKDLKTLSHALLLWSKSLKS